MGATVRAGKAKRSRGPVVGRLRVRRLIVPTVVVVACAAIALRWMATAAPQQHNLPEGTYRVARVVSGDSLELTDQTRIRLLGIVSPYRPRSAKQGRGDAGNSIAASRPASAVETGSTSEMPDGGADLLRNLVGAGQVRLQFDRNCLGDDGSLVAYVWVDDGTGGSQLLNEELIRAGAARWDSHCPCSSPIKRRLKQAADDAKAAGRGLWATAR